MKKIILLAYIAVCGAVLAGCNDSAPYNGEGIDSELNRLYSNKTYTQPGAGVLDLYYSGGPIEGKDVYLQMMTANTARLTLNKIIPGEDVTRIEDVPVTCDGERYTLGGMFTTASGMKLDVNGDIVGDRLRLSLENITIENALSRIGKHRFDKNTPWIFEWKVWGLQDKVDEDGNPIYDDEGNKIQESVLVDHQYEIAIQMRIIVWVTVARVQVYEKLPELLPVFLTDVLPQVDFRPDANMIATYGPFDTENLDIMSIVLKILGLGGGSSTDPEEPEEPEELGEEYSDSPLNMLHYTVEGNSVYLRPNLNMLLGLLGGDGDMSGFASYLSALLNDIPTVMQWLTKGIKFNFVPNDNENVDAQYKLYLDRKELNILLPILSELLDDLELDLDIDTALYRGINDGVKGLVKDIAANIQDAAVLNIGFYL